MLQTLLTLSTPRPRVAGLLLVLGDFEILVPQDTFIGAVLSWACGGVAPSAVCCCVAPPPLCIVVGMPPASLGNPECLVGSVCMRERRGRRGHVYEREQEPS